MLCAYAVLVRLRCAKLHAEFWELSHEKTNKVSGLMLLQSGVETDNKTSMFINRIM